MLKEIALVLLQGLPRFHGDTETPAERDARTNVIASSEASAAHAATCTGSWSEADFCVPVWRGTPVEAVVFLTMTGFMESGFAEHIHKGQCKPYECDAVKLPGGRVFFKARTPWQLQRTRATRAHWSDMVGDTPYATFEAAYAALKVAGAARARCGRSGPWLVGTISGYAGSRTCSWKGAPRRAKLFNRLLAKAQAVQTPGGSESSRARAEP